MVRTSIKTGNPTFCKALVSDQVETSTYNDRNLVERFFARLKQFRRIATRYEKLARNFNSMLNLTCAYIWLV